ncbi:DUF1624 domain-containing protein [Spirosoma sp. KNUC1025]|uniref:DUF1624 domain-containing protein n=1 Tax=Spirosoma sp. KNUC1025 TaxID=2894082 RepID=UPI003866C609|nr:heparan-alpha-glucosaminide N-acetyltransferase domain-containing protein [Spirosoma sp. KNUC1025]
MLRTETMEAQIPEMGHTPTSALVPVANRLDGVSVNQSTARLTSIDTLRGLVMVIMALDHTRDFLHVNGMFYNPTDLNTTNPALFFTRILTHICAPTFVFLAGLSAKLSGAQRGARQLSGFLLSRGLWFIFLEITVINFAFWFDPTFSFVQLQVMWAIGISMIVLSGLIWLPGRVLLCIGLGLVTGHNLLDGVTVSATSRWYWLWSMVHERSVIRLTPDFQLAFMYPVLPWIGIMTLGYCAGNWYDRSVTPAWRRRKLVWIGIAALTSFILLRLTNVYGDPLSWHKQSDVVLTLMSFLNVTKYPPSLLYTLLLLGIALLMLSALESRRVSWMNIFAVYGRVPLFYYVLHFYLIHAVSVLHLLAAGVSWQRIDFKKGTGGIPPGEGVSLGMTYLIWFVLVVALYPLCNWYYRFKRTRTGWFWRYL